MIVNDTIELYLASQSPRRRALLKEIGFTVKIVKAPDVEENYPPQLKAAEIPMFLAKLKADAYTEELPDNAILVTADTIVWLDNEVLGKPADMDDAIIMLGKLSGKMHQVFTGVNLKLGDKQVCFYDVTNVYFRELSTDEIRYYVEKYQPLDKAGAYGVQEWIGFTGVERVEGSYFNVMGLPTHKLYSELHKLLKDRL
jgi:septum formation protein